MSPIIAPAVATRHLERLETASPTMAKADLKNLELSWRERIGRAVGRSFALADLSQKEAAALLSRDPGQVGRWLTGAERAQLDILFAVAALRQPLVQALGELAGADVQITVTLRGAR